MAKKQLLKANQGDTLSRLLTEELLKRSGVKLPSNAPGDPDLQLVIDRHKSQVSRSAKASKLPRATVRKLAGV
jgi:hypothetical protein